MLVEDLSIFLGDFGEPANLNNCAQVTVIFSSNYDPMALGADGRSIVALGRTEELGTVLQGDRLEIRNLYYTVVSAEPIQDGKFTRLQLEEV